MLRRTERVPKIPGGEPIPKNQSNTRPNPRKTQVSWIDVNESHHAASLMFEDVTMEHPLTQAFRHERQVGPRARLQQDRVAPGPELALRGQLDHRKAVEMDRM